MEGGRVAPMDIPVTAPQNRRFPRVVSLLALLVGTVPGLAHAQALYTAERRADLQVGVDFSLVNPDYANDVYHLAQPTTGQLRWHGYGAYADLGLRYHFSLEAEIHQASGPDPTLYERSFLFGVRVPFPVKRRVVPYAKVMAGRGIFNFAAIDPTTGKSTQIANLGYNTEALGGGIDLRLRPGLNVRLFDYEYQRWNNFPPNKLNPQIITFGVAYHFHGRMGLRR